MTPEQMIEKYKAAEKVQAQLQKQLWASNEELREIRQSYWKLAGHVQVGDTVTNGEKTGIVDRIEISNWATPPNLNPTIVVKLFKKDGTLGDRVTKIYFYETKWKVTKKAA